MKIKSLALTAIVALAIGTSPTYRGIKTYQICYEQRGEKIELGEINEVGRFCERNYSSPDISVRNACAKLDEELLETSDDDITLSLLDVVRRMEERGVPNLDSKKKQITLLLSIRDLFYDWACEEEGHSGIVESQLYDSNGNLAGTLIEDFPTGSYEKLMSLLNSALDYCKENNIAQNKFFSPLRRGLGGIMRIISRKDCPSTHSTIYDVNDVLELMDLPPIFCPISDFTYSRSSQ